MLIATALASGGNVWHGIVVVPVEVMVAGIMTVLVNAHWKLE